MKLEYPCTLHTLLSALRHVGLDPYFEDDDRGGRLDAFVAADSAEEYRNFDCFCDNPSFSLTLTFVSESFDPDWSRLRLKHGHILEIDFMFRRDRSSIELNHQDERYFLAIYDSMRGYFHIELNRDAGTYAFYIKAGDDRGSWYG